MPQKIKPPGVQSRTFLAPRPRDSRRLALLNRLLLLGLHQGNLLESEEPQLQLPRQPLPQGRRRKSAARAPRAASKSSPSTP